MIYAKKVMQKRLEIIGHLRVQCCNENHWPTFKANLEEADQKFTLPQLVAMREILFTEFDEFRKETNAHKMKVSTYAGYVPRSTFLADRKKSKVLARTLASMTQCYGLIEDRLKEYGLSEPSPREILEESLKRIENPNGKISFFGEEGADAAERRDRAEVVKNMPNPEIKSDRRPIGWKGMK